MKYFELSSKSRPSSHWIKFAAASLIAVAIAGCGGGGTGANTAVSNPASVTNMAASSWQALKPKIDPNTISVSIPPDGKPVVNFTVTDDVGNPVIGLGGQVAGTATTLPTNYNLQFTLAKLIPADSTTGAPSKWVSYLVSKPGTIAGGVVTSWLGTYPTSDTNGTLVDNNNGSYQYKFLRNIKAIKDIVPVLPDIPASGTTPAKLTADLGTVAELTYDETATHRLGILIVGSQPDTGTNTPDKLFRKNPVPLLETFNIGYDFVPNGPKTVTRNIVKKESCSDCHDGRAIGHFSVKGFSSATVGTAVFGGGLQYSIPNGIPAGAYVGRNDPNLCVTCHTDQTKYTFAEVTMGTPNPYPVYTGTYARINGESAMTMPRMVHQIHMGSKLVGSGYNLKAHCNPDAETGLAACFANTTLPQNPSDCTKCHDGNTSKSDGTPNSKWTDDGNNWLTKPSIIACGACHDGINFATGTGFTTADKRLGRTVPTGHGGDGTAANNGIVVAATNAQCASCHSSATGRNADFEISLVHRTNTMTLNNPDTPVGYMNLAYNIKSVTLNATTGQPTFVFQILKQTRVNGATVNTPVTALAVPTPVVNGKTGVVTVPANFEPIPGLANGPAFYIAYSVPQDGITAPADFNASHNVKLADLLVATGAPKAGSLTNTVTNGAYQADANGFFTATLTGDTLGQPVGAGCTAPVAPALATCVNTAVLATPIVIPATAKIVTGAMIGTFVQTDLAAFPYTPANVTTNPNVAASATAKGLVRNVMLKKLVATGFAPRRNITNVAKCNTCHDQLGTDPTFHGGARNDPEACDICHGANKTSSGWSANASTFVHGIHGASKRTTDFMWTAVSATDNYSKIGYPGLLKNCSKCHLPNTVNFGANGGTALTPNLLWPTNAAATISTTSNTFRNSPDAVAGVNYGNVFSYTAAGATVAAYTPATAGLPTAAGGTTVAGTAVTAHVAAAGGETVPADPANLVSSPISSACYACHDTAAAKTHMQGQGGKIYAPRSTVTVAGKLNNTEDCLTCHGVGRTADVAAIHK